MQTFTLQKDEQRVITLTQSGDYTVELAGTGAHADIQGVFQTVDFEEVDINLFIVHSAPHTSAQTTLRGAAKDSSRIRFFGRIKIDPGCPDTKSFLEERILLLSQRAKAEAVPELEILSDDVKCSHAASVSRIPATQLFYLKSRGLSQVEAEKVILDGFLTLPNPS